MIFSSKTRVLVWCGLKQAENEPNTTCFSKQRLSLAENLRIQKRAFSAGFQAGNSLFKNPSTCESGFRIEHIEWRSICFYIIIKLILSQLAIKYCMFINNRKFLLIHGRKKKLTSGDLNLQHCSSRGDALPLSYSRMWGYEITKKYAQRTQNNL